MLRTRTGSLRLPLILGGAVVVLAAVGMLVLRGSSPGTGGTTNTGAPTGGTDPLNVAVRTDTDGDGITDPEEAALGTDPAKADTDSDGLSDREEAKVYGTDPLKSDTDGDGHSDGSEVDTGFNPKGPGELLPTTESLRNLNAAPANVNLGS